MCIFLSQGIVAATAQHASGSAVPTWQNLEMPFRACWSVAVTVAVQCYIFPTFSALASCPLCAQFICKVLAKCDFQDIDLLTADDS